MKQYRIIWLGNFYHVLSLSMTLFAIFAYAMSAVTLYAVWVIPYVKPKLPWINLPIYFAFIIVVCCILLAVVYVLLYSGYYYLQNKQIYIHNNPIKDDLDTIKAENKQMKEDLAKIKTHMGIKDE
jgi:hypothetical protein